MAQGVIEVIGGDIVEDVVVVGSCTIKWFVHGAGYVDHGTRKHFRSVESRSLVEVVGGLHLVGNNLSLHATA